MKSGLVKVVVSGTLVILLGYAGLIPVAAQETQPDTHIAESEITAAEEEEILRDGIDAAESWLEYVDAGKYRESWGTALILNSSHR